MKHNYVFIVLLLVGFLWGNNALAQGYSAWSEIYNRNGTKVSISFRTSTNSCDPSGKTNKYRFNIEGALQSGKKELLVTIKYQNCSKADSKEQKYIDIGTQGGAIGINESIGYTLTGDISERTVRLKKSKRMCHHRQLLPIRNLLILLRVQVVLTLPVHLQVLRNIKSS